MSLKSLPGRVWYVSLADVTVVTLAGHSFAFESGVPLSVPNQRVVVEAVKAAGCVDVASITDEKLRKTLGLDGAIESAGTVEDDRELADTERADLLIAACKTLADSGEPSAFTSGGKPTTTALESIVGGTVTSKERDDAWKTYSAEKA